MNLSFWEKNTWFSDVHFCIVGSGIVGLSCALELRKNYPKSKILVLERGFLPKGASTKNAGFACYGSVSELLADLQNHTENEVLELVKQRFKGLQLLRSLVGDHQLNYQEHGGYEVFLNSDSALYEKCHDQLKYINALVEPVFGKNAFKLQKSSFGFKNSLENLIFNPFEGQIDVGLMMKNLLKKAQSEDILILNGVEVKEFSSHTSRVHIQLKDVQFSAQHICIATNAFAGQFFDLDLKPARNQVIITSPIKGLPIKGVFHLNQGYYYFRNIGDRILLGGGRHLDKEGETTRRLGTTKVIQNNLENLLKTTVLPKYKPNIEHTWSGILGIGKQKKPIVESVDNRVHCAVRLGGMGVAIGSNIGKRLALLVK